MRVCGERDINNIKFLFNDYYAEYYVSVFNHLHDST